MIKKQEFSKSLHGKMIKANILKNSITLVRSYLIVFLLYITYQNLGTKICLAINKISGIVSTGKKTIDGAVLVTWGTPRLNLDRTDLLPVFIFLGIIIVIPSTISAIYSLGYLIRTYNEMKGVNYNDNSV